MMKNILRFAILLSIWGCTSVPNVYFTDNLNQIHSSSVETVSLQGHLVLDGLYGISDMKIVQNYLCLTIPKLERMLHLYSLNGDSICSIGRRGNGPNDFINCCLNGQSSVDGENAYLWINDVSNAELKRIDLTKSIKNESCYVDKHVKTLPMSVNAFYINDSLVVQEVMTERNYNLFVGNADSISEYNTLYSIDVSGPFSYYKSIFRLDPSSSFLISAMQSINQINYINWKTKERISSCVGTITKWENIVDKKTGLENWTYYADLKVTNDCVYALYMDQNYNDSYEVEKPVEIHVFDKRGKLVKILNLDKYLVHFDIDENTSTLYGLMNDSEIYSYKI